MDEFYFGHHTGFGSLHSIDSDAPYDVIAELRASVEEITGKKINRPRIGFDLSRKQ